MRHSSSVGFAYTHIDTLVKVTGKLKTEAANSGKLRILNSMLDQIMRRLVLTTTECAGKLNEYLDQLQPDTFQTIYKMSESIDEDDTEVKVQLSLDSRLRFDRDAFWAMFGPALTETLEMARQQLENAVLQMEAADTMSEDDIKFQALVGGESVEDFLSEQLKTSVPPEMSAALQNREPKVFCESRKPSNHKVDCRLDARHPVEENHYNPHWNLSWPHTDEEVQRKLHGKGSNGQVA